MVFNTNYAKLAPLPARMEDWNGNFFHTSNLLSKMQARDKQMCKGCLQKNNLMCRNPLQLGAMYI